MLDRFARVLARPLELANAEDREAEAIVVLGNPVRTDGSLSAIGEERVAAALELFSRDAAPFVLFTGKDEAGPMAERAIELGLPAGAAWIENESRTTRENAVRAAEMLARDGRAGPWTVWVVSQPFHLRRACFIFRRAGFDPRPFALPDGVQTRRPGLALKWSVREYVAWAKAGFDALRRA